MSSSMCWLSTLVASTCTGKEKILRTRNGLVTENVGWINSQWYYSHLYNRDNDQQNHWVQWGLAYFQTHPNSSWAFSCFVWTIMNQTTWFYGGSLIIRCLECLETEVVNYPCAMLMFGVLLWLQLQPQVQGVPTATLEDAHLCRGGASKVPCRKGDGERRRWCFFLSFYVIVIIF